MSDQETPTEILERLRARMDVRERRFVEEFVQTGDSDASYKLAFNVQTGTAGRVARLLGKWYVQDYLRAYTKKADPLDLQIGSSEVLEHLASILRGTGEDSDRIASARVINKMRGYDAPKVVKVDQKTDVRVSGGLDITQRSHMRDAIGIPT